MACSQRENAKRDCRTALCSSPLGTKRFRMPTAYALGILSGKNCYKSKVGQPAGCPTLQSSRKTNWRFSLAVMPALNLVTALIHQQGFFCAPAQPAGCRLWRKQGTRLSGLSTASAPSDNAVVQVGPAAFALFGRSHRAAVLALLCRNAVEGGGFPPRTLWASSAEKNCYKSKVGQPAGCPTLQKTGFSLAVRSQYRSTPSLVTRAYTSGASSGFSAPYTRPLRYSAAAASNLSATP